MCFRVRLLCAVVLCAVLVLCAVCCVLFSVRDFPITFILYGSLSTHSTRYVFGSVCRWDIIIFDEESWLFSLSMRATAAQRGGVVGKTKSEVSCLPPRQLRAVASPFFQSVRRYAVN